MRPEPTHPIPDSPQAWLEEIAAAYRDAREAIPFGPLVGEKIGPERLFHLGPQVCLKFRGIKPTKKLLKQAIDAALASYVGNQDSLPEVFGVPQLAFAFTYLASHFGLRLLTEQQVDALMQFIEGKEAELVELTGE